MQRLLLLAVLAMPPTSWAASQELVDECNAKTRAIWRSYDNGFTRTRNMEGLRSECEGTGIFEARLALMYADVRRLDEADEMIEAARQFAPAFDKEIAIATMSLLVPRRGREQSLEIGKQITADHPDWPDGFIALAYAQMWNGNGEEMIAALNEANRLEEAPRTHLMLMHAYRGMDDYEASLAAYDRALEIDKNAIREYTGIVGVAEVLLELKRYEEALDLVDRHKAASPQTAALIDLILPPEKFLPEDQRPKKKQRSMITSNVGSANRAEKAGITFADDLDDLLDAGNKREKQQPPIIDPTKPRTNEEIEYVFYQTRGPIFALYNRALRRDPKIEGRVTFRLTILPNGQVDACEIVDSEITDEDLLDKLQRRIKLMRFAPLDVPGSRTVEYPIDFIPA